MDERTIVVVIPTYNERENIQALVEKIIELKIKELRIIIVDDNSPDGTGVLAETLSGEFSLSVIHRKSKDGLGTAYREAFNTLLKNEHPPDVIIQMDADLSHNPDDIPRFLEAIKHYDVVLGSRYISGGGIKNWNIFRLFLSRFSNFYARKVLLLPIYDLTGGFKCWKRTVLQNIDLEHTSSIGYNFQIETTFRAHRKGFRVGEIPITFTERTFGKSKFSIPIIFESFWKVIKLRFNHE